MDPTYLQSLPAATDIIELVLHNSIIKCRDKEINKKLRPFSMVYTMEVLQMTFGQKSLQRDNRNDDVYIFDEDIEDPKPSGKDNICHELGMNQDPRKLEAYRAMNASIMSDKSMNKSGSKKGSIGKGKGGSKLLVSKLRGSAL